MKVRQLGTLAVPSIGFGAMVLSPGTYGQIDDQSARTALLHALERGSSFVDTSDAYGTASHNESLLGAALRNRRDDVVISTKFGLKPPAGAERHCVELAYGTLAVNAEPRHIRGYATASLQRLMTDHLDLYSPHFPDPAVPIEDTVGAIAELVDDGLVRHIGLSNVTSDQLERAAKVHPISAVQCEWSMWTDVDPSLLEVCDRLGIGVVAWGPLGGGFLTGSIDDLDPGDLRSRFPRLTTHNLAVNNERFQPFRRIADDVGCTPGQLALAWLLHRHPSVVPIPGSRTPAHITENIDAADIELAARTVASVDLERAAFQPAGGSILEPPPTGGR